MIVGTCLVFYDDDDDDDVMTILGEMVARSHALW